ncbi:MAG: hypothetical protein K2K23_11365 [Muribaculaceae bacterium]|nr:hypothetical protein [Muribaculaceae bacterium]
MSILRHIFAVTLFAVGVETSCPQSITESVTVEGKYTPDIFPADRLALLPEAITLKAPDSKMAYDRKGLAANFAPDALNLPPTGWLANKKYDTSKGYAALWLGSWLNSSLSAGYNAVNTQDTRLNVYLQHNSTSLWKAWEEEKISYRPEAAKRFRYDETIGADLRRNVPDAGTLTCALQYHLGYFNYYGAFIGSIDYCEKAPSQTVNDVYARVGWTGADNGRLIYSAEADVRHFGYRSMYVPQPDDLRYVRTKGERESALNLGGEVKYSLSQGSGNRSAIGIGLKYSGVLNSIGNDVNRVEATPAYTLVGRNYALRLGANLAVVGNGDQTRFRIAPDLRFSVRKGVTAFSASIGGGTYLRTLAWMHEMDYYANPGIGCYEAAKSPLDIRLAFQYNPGGRLTLGLEALWNTTLDETFGGLYQAMLNQTTYYYGQYPESGRIHGFSIAVNAGYEFCRYFALKGKASWQPQDGSKGVLNGFDRPEVTADLSAESLPTDRLSIRFDYRLRAKRQLLPGSFSRLDLSADYRITDRISVGVQLDNLLNRHEEFLPGQLLEGFNALGGVQIVF